jgi:hypothetical protein
MLNTLKFTITGCEYSDIYIPTNGASVQDILQTIKLTLLIPNEDIIDIYDADFKKIENTIKGFEELVSNNSVYKICVLNKLWSPFVNEETILSNQTAVFIDTVSRHKYTCINAKCRKTFDTCQDLFSHYQVHYKERPFK